MQKINIVVVDDDKLAAISLKTIIESTGGGEITVAAVGNSGEEAIELYERLRPDVLLMDIRMGGMSGLEAGERILADHPAAKVLYLTTFSDDDYIIKALSIGAKGYILKQDFEGIAPALKAVMNGKSGFGEQVMSRIPQLMQGGRRAEAGSGFDMSAAGLGATEQEMIQLVAEGLSNREIAAQLYLSEGTVRNYLSGIFEKLAVRDRTQLAIFYYTRVV